MAATLVDFTFFLIFLILPCFTYSIKTHDDDNKVGNFQRLQLNSGVGPESFAFDCSGEGPYTGVSDGRILKWRGSSHGWTEFAVTSQTRRRDVCDGSNEPILEPLCGRPLGLKFNKKTCDLYIADAYFGLLKVGPKGGVATLLASSAEEVPFRFTNGVEIDEEEGNVYFTDSSSCFQRWEYLLVMLSGDNTGRLMKYNPQSKQVTVLLRGLKMANGVALSKDKAYILVAETTRSRILRYWLRGPKAGTSEVFSQLPGYPDNIKRNSMGEFWVAINNGGGRLVKSKKSTIGTVSVSSNNTFLVDNVIGTLLDKDSNVLQVLRSSDGKKMESVSEVEEINGTLWIGSVVMPYVSLYKV